MTEPATPEAAIRAPVEATRVVTPVVADGGGSFTPVLIPGLVESGPPAAVAGSSMSLRELTTAPWPAGHDARGADRRVTTPDYRRFAPIPIPGLIVNRIPHAGIRPRSDIPTNESRPRVGPAGRRGAPAVTPPLRRLRQVPEGLAAPIPTPGSPAAQQTITPSDTHAGGRPSLLQQLRVNAATPTGTVRRQSTDAPVPPVAPAPRASTTMTAIDAEIVDVEPIVQRVASDVDHRNNVLNTLRGLAARLAQDEAVIAEFAGGPQAPAGVGPSLARLQALRAVTDRAVTSAEHWHEQNPAGESLGMMNERLGTDAVGYGARNWEQGNYVRGAAGYVGGAGMAVVDAAQQMLSFGYHEASTAVARAYANGDISWNEGERILRSAAWRSLLAAAVTRSAGAIGGRLGVMASRGLGIPPRALMAGAVSGLSAGAASAAGGLSAQSLTTQALGDSFESPTGRAIWSSGLPSGREWLVAIPISMLLGSLTGAAQIQSANTRLIGTVVETPDGPTSVVAVTTEGSIILQPSGGGVRVSPPQPPIADIMMVYDPATNTWTEPPTGRMAVAATSRGLRPALPSANQPVGEISDSGISPAPGTRAETRSEYRQRTSLERWRSAIEAAFSGDLADQAQAPPVTGGRSDPRIEGARVPGAPPARLDLEDIPRLPGETQREAVARVRTVIGHTISEFPEMTKMWNDARAVILSHRTLTPENSRVLFDATRNAFYRRLRGNTSAMQTLSDAGLELIGVNATAPRLRGAPAGTRAAELIVSLDHVIERAADWQRALDADNLRFEFAAPNTDRENVQMRHPELRP